MEQLRPTPAARHSFPATFIHRNLKDSTHVFLRYDAISRALDPLYNGPHKVIARTDKTFNIVVLGRQDFASADRVKPAYILHGTRSDITTNTSSPPAQTHSATAAAVTQNSGSADHRVRSQNVCFAARLNTSVVFSAGGHVGCSHMSKNSFLHATTSTYPTVIQNYIKAKFMIQALFTP